MVAISAKHAPENATSALIDGFGWMDIKPGSMTDHEGIASWVDAHTNETVLVKRDKVIGLGYASDGESE